MTITETPGFWKIQFSFKPWLIEKVKEIPGRQWRAESKAWYVPFSQSEHVRAFARVCGLQIIENGTGESPEATYEIPPLPELAIDIDTRFYSRSKKAAGDPRHLIMPYQKNGIARGMELKRLINGDEPGLGKTVQSIVTVSLLDAFPCLVICPSSLKMNWQKEILDWTGGASKGLILEDKIKGSFRQYYTAGLAQFFIVNFESLKKYFVESIDVPEGQKLTLKHIKFNGNRDFFKSVIIDESHRVKSNVTQQTKFTKGICTGKETVVACTGTPVVNKPKDLMAQLSIIGRLDTDFAGYRNFENTYCQGPKEASNLKLLNFKLNTTCFYRRDKKDVLKDLPAKMRQIVYCDITTRKEYADAEADLQRYLYEYKKATEEDVQRSMRGEIMVKIGILKNISARGKLKDVTEFISDTLESGEKLGIFAHQHQIIDSLKATYPGTLCITGRETLEQRNNAVVTFQGNAEAKLIFLGIKAAGVGLTLTAASRCGFIELDWHPAIHDQCEDRFHRIGQKDSVQCTYFLGKNTIDEWVYQTIEDKRKMANAIVGTEDTVERSVIDNFINLFAKQ